ncbi:MAG: peptide deformylase [Chitinophagaceae bacterium]
MVLPIVAYGHSILRQNCSDIDEQYPHLQQLIDDMWQTMYGAKGCGLAAPQVNYPVKIFIIDSLQTYKNFSPQEREDFFDGDEGIQETFINARIIDTSYKTWFDEEGCLSIPALAAEIERPWSITIEYLDRNFQPQSKVFSGATARMIQHEYDHTEGILYLDYLKPLKRTLMKTKLDKIVKGKIKAAYPMAFVQ